jgi:acylphosphatase
VTQQQRRVLYAGSVQGVGFRYRTVRLAGGFDVTGYVRNLADGRVELVVEGELSELTVFLGKLEAELGSFIADAKVESAPVTREFEKFGIRF